LNEDDISNELSSEDPILTPELNKLETIVSDPEIKNLATLTAAAFFYSLHNLVNSTQYGEVQSDGVEETKEHEPIINE
jgi:hypothetical protein